MNIYSPPNNSLSVEKTGGKGKNLFSLIDLGINVPPFIVMDPAELENIIPDELKHKNAFEEIVQIIDDFRFPPSFEQSLSNHFKNSDQKIYAVRSSAVQEDGKKFSFAGQFESHLYVDWKDIPKFVKEVWKSNFSDRVAAYLKSNDITPQFGIGVIVQEMINPDVSGVAFGVNPNTGTKDSKVICSVYGVGEGIVSGELNADTFTLEQEKISSDIVKKDRKGVRAGSGEIAYETVPDAKQELPSLSEKEIKEIAKILQRLEKELKAPQDIEFAVKDGEVFLLQTRPITSVYPSQEKEKKNRIIWDNSNIVESYPGVTTPLTFSYIREAYEKVYLQLAAIMGADKKTLKDNEKVFANMLGLINGRVYYNLLSWYKVLALFPGYSLNARFMENMMGVKERFNLEKKPNTNKLKALYRTGVMITKIIGNLMTIKKQTRKFMAEVDKSLEEIKQLPMDEMTAYELKTTWINLDAHLTPKWKAPLINDSFAMIYFGKLQKLIEKYKISDNPNLQNDLLCGSKDIISVEPVHRSIALATEIGENTQLKELFLNHSEQEIWDRLQKENHPFLQKIQEYINKFGERCVGELKLETISFNQDPTLFLQTLKSFVKQNVKTSSTESTIDKDLRDAGEKVVKKSLKNRPLRRLKFRRTLKKARYFVSNRENLRYERTRVFGITREIFSAIGKQFASNKAIEHHRDIFYLTKEEIFDFIEGTSVTKNLKALIKTRKEEYAAFEEMPTPPDRITTYETVNYYNDFYEETESDMDESADLKGIGCCPGIVKAKVRIVKHPNEVDSLDGDILVTSSTDPGWVTLFPTCSAIIVERGSLLSHSAIVSREMGIPCIVGVTHLLKQLKTGETVEMDGSKGTIKRIEK